VTVREALRQKLAVNLLVFAVALVSASFVISQLTFGEQYRVIVNIALSSMEIFGTLIAVFLGANLVAGDVQRRTVYAIVAKPVSRAQYVAGRYLGLVVTTTLNLASWGCSPTTCAGSASSRRHRS
jgi:ABC-type transport system involved in multi-copper enzyme maturation permease subunit